MTVSYVKVEGTVCPFPQLKFPALMRRPEGEIDLLVGIHEAGLHPRVLSCVGNLRLMSNQFGSGYLLDGSYEQLSNSPVLLSREAYEKTHSVQFLAATKSPTLKVVNRV